MNPLPVLMLMGGLLLIYAGITNRNPKDIISASFAGQTADPLAHITDSPKRQPPKDRHGGAYKTAVFNTAQSNV